MTKTKQEIINGLMPEKVKFKVDEWEDLILRDISQFDEDMRIKLNRNLTTTFNQWIDNKIRQKEQIKINIKGQTRSGKSLIGLKIIYLTTKQYKEKKFSSDNSVCANQKELRQKLNTAKFGDSFLIDENAFANVGTGSMTELQQLKDINNIVAKQNIHMVYITPQTFLMTGATMGLSYFGKDVENWVSRFLLYSLKNSPVLLGYVIFDVGSLFRDTGCLIYKLTGGCPNPKRIKLKDIPKENIKFSSCIPKDINLTEIEKKSNSEVCPFYDVCKSEMCSYEHKKDKWILREMKGGFGERETEKIEVSIELIRLLGFIDKDSNKIRLSAKNGKELKLKIKMKLPTINNTKYTGVEIEEIIQMVISLLDLNFFKDVCSNLEMDYEKTIKELYSDLENKRDTSKT